MRTFQFSDAKSHKFWNIDVTGTSFTVTYGKIGTAGQTQIKDWPTAEKAQSEAEKLVREKTGKGYTETTPQASSSDSEAFEKTLIAHPDDNAAWSAYADYLTEQNNPRGEFMQVQLALEDETLTKPQRAALTKKEAALLKTHQEEWLGPLAPFLLAPKKSGDRHTRILYKFRRGWLTELSIPNLGVELVRAMIRTPELRFLQRLTIETSAYEEPADAANIPSYVDGTYQPGPDIPADVMSEDVVWHMLAKFPHFGGLRMFHLGNKHGDNFEDSDQCHTSGEMAYHFIKQMPNVEELYLLAHRVDANKLFALPMPQLRILQLYHSTSYPLEKLAENKSVTKLTHLLCHTHAVEVDDEAPYIHLKQLRAIGKATHWTQLQYLLLRVTDFGDEGAKEIVKSGMLKRLKVLDLQAGCISDQGAEALANCPDVSNLDRLNLDINALTEAGIGMLTKVCKELSTLQQHDSKPPFEEGEPPEFFYMGDME